MLRLGQARGPANGAASSAGASRGATEGSCSGGPRGRSIGKRPPSPHLSQPKPIRYARIESDVDLREDAELRRLEGGRPGQAQPWGSPVRPAQQRADPDSPDAEITAVGRTHVARWNSLQDMLQSGGRRHSEVPGDGACLYWAYLAACDGGVAHALREYVRRGDTPLQQRNGDDVALTGRRCFRHPTRRQRTLAAW